MSFRRNSPVLSETYAWVFQGLVDRTMPGAEDVFDAARKLLGGSWIVPICHTTGANGLPARRKNGTGTTEHASGLERVWLEAAP